ncbi:MAG TPA: hypothetical protein VFS13_08425 [Steroidobacteraceae bacterium]|nr:hypothetical protein [Steroidobacteraceae bacterium]
MGTWGTSISSDDTVADVVATVVDRMKAGASLDDASEFALSRFKRSLKDPDHGPLIWLALGRVQWKYGRVNPKVLDHIHQDISRGRGLGRWRDDAVALVRRRRALQAFFEKISRVNLKPAPLPRFIVRLAPFAAGDCLAVMTRDEKYTAAIVLEADNSRPEGGCNLIGSLDYLSGSPPTQHVFDRRNWLYKHHGNWNGAPDLSWYLPVGFRKERRRIAIVGKTAIRREDPRRADVHAGWGQLGEQILLARSCGPPGLP